MDKKLVKEAQKRLTFASDYISESMIPASSIAWQWAIYALGNATLNWDVAVRYFERALQGQQENGAILMEFKSSTSDPMLPLVERPYFAPILWRLFEMAPDADLGEQFLQQFFPKVLEHQMYWYKYRNLHDEGLVSIIHPWEAPLPELDVWDSPEYGQVFEYAENQNASDSQRHHRTDLLSTRPRSATPQYLLDHPFLIQDPYLNALLSLSNTFLLQMGQYLRHDVRELMEYQELTVFAANDKLWNPEYGIYCSYDQNLQQTVLSGSLSGWMPLISPIPDQSYAESMRLSFEANFLHEDYFLSASNSIYGNRTVFTALNKGALHLWDNWLLYQGLLRFDFDDLARQVRIDSMDLVSEYGFHLFFHPQRSKSHHLGLGAGNQPAAAALFLEFYNKKIMRVEE